MISAYSVGVDCEGGGGGGGGRLATIPATSAGAHVTLIVAMHNETLVRKEPLE